MALLEKGLEYILGVVTENEEVKNFPKDFVTASMQWVRSWFLIDDPKTAAKLEDPYRPVESKKTILESKMEDLLENPKFIAELEAQLAAFEQHKIKSKNVVENTNIDAQGSVHIGDKGSFSIDNYYDKNIIKGSTIKAGGDFRLGDDVITGNHQVQIVHNYFQGAKPEQPTASTQDNLKAELKKMVTNGKIKEAFERLMDITEKSDNDTYNTVLLLSGQYNRLKDKQTRGIVDDNQANLEHNRMTYAIIEVIDGLSVK